MIIAGVIVLMLVLSFLAPSLSRHPERGIVGALSFPRRLVGMLPGPIGHWAAKPFGSAQRNVGRSARGGRKARGKLPV